MKPEYGNLPFDKAIKFFRDKLNIPTKKWSDLWGEQHAKGFMTAGANKADLLNDMRTAVDKAIADGVSLQTFRKDFDKIVETHGWAYNGSRNWRSDLIYATNIRTAYSAGRWEQQTSKDSLRSKPFLEYRHGDSRYPRKEHLAWNGLVLSAEDDWWQSHYPPNGYGCKCRVFAIGNRDMKKLGKEGPDNAPDDGYEDWTDKTTGETKQIPKGIDPGFEYNPGIAKDKTYEILSDKIVDMDFGIARHWIHEVVTGPTFERFHAGKIAADFPVAVSKGGEVNDPLFISKSLDIQNIPIEMFMAIQEAIDSNGKITNQLSVVYKGTTYKITIDGNIIVSIE